MRNADRILRRVAWCAVALATLLALQPGAGRSHALLGLSLAATLAVYLKATGCRTRRRLAKRRRDRNTRRNHR